MKRTVRLLAILLVLCLEMTWVGRGEATLQANKLFKETYPGKDAAYYNCAICHNAKIGKKGDLNPYGQSLKLQPPAALTVEQLKAAESLDPDGDGVPSVGEIQQGRHPGVPEK